MGCKCTHNQDESKSELLNIISKDINVKIDDSHNDYLKSSISNSANYNYENKPSQEKQSNPFSYSETKNEINQNPNQYYDDYSEKMFVLINKIRENPPLYADEIEKAIENIWEEKSKDINGNNKIIYKQRVKVRLNRGEVAFKEASKELRQIKPIASLKFKKEICIPLPDKEEYIKNSNYLKDQVRIIREKNKIDVFYKDLIKDPDVSVLLMIVDDNTKNPGKKRQAVLDENFKYIGISSGFVGKSFIAYFSFSK